MKAISQETVQDDVARLRHLLDAALNDLQSAPPGSLHRDVILRVAALVEIGRDMAHQASISLLEDFDALNRKSDPERG